MVKHIVLFKLRDDVSVEKKLVVMNSFKEAIEALPAKISVIRKIEVGLNMNPGETWNIALYSEFDNPKDAEDGIRFCNYLRATTNIHIRNQSHSPSLAMDW